jgi:hypothetical protein
MNRLGKDMWTVVSSAMVLFSANDCQERYNHLDHERNSIIEGNSNTLASSADANAQKSKSKEVLESPRECTAETPRVSKSEEVGGRWVSSPWKSSGSSKSSTGLSTTSAKQAQGAEQAQQETPGSWKGGGGGGGGEGEGEGEGAGGVKREGSFTSNNWLKSQLIHVKQVAEEKFFAAHQRHASPHATSHENRRDAATGQAEHVASPPGGAAGDVTPAASAAEEKERVPFLKIPLYIDLMW